MDANLECCVLGCHTKPNQGLHFYRFPCHNPQISSNWEQRICQSGNIDLLNDRVCELHFDYRCKTGNECALEEGSLPTLHLPGFGNLFSADNAHFQMSADRVEEPSYTISIGTLPYHCRFCLRKGLLYEVKASTYRSKSFSSLIDLPPNVVPDNAQSNACLSCLKAIVITHQLSMIVEHSNTILQLLLQNPIQSKVVSNTNFLDMKSELAFCNLILANSISIKLEIELGDSMVCGNEEYEPKWVATGDSTSPVGYMNSQYMFDKSTCVTENQDNVSKIHDSITSDKLCQKEFHKSFPTGEYTTDFSAEVIANANENFDSCVLTENTDDNDKVMVSNSSDDSCAEDRQFDEKQPPESTNKALNEATYKCDLCTFTTKYKANLAIHKNLHLSNSDTEYFFCQKCEKYFLLRRHFIRHNKIVHADEFTCTICDKTHACTTKLADHYTEHHHFQCEISSRVLHMLDHKRGQMTFITMDKNTHWIENDGVYVCPICDWKNPSFHTFSMHMGKHKEQSDKNSTTGSQEMETLKTDSVRNADGRYQCTVCSKTFSQKRNLSVHKTIHTNERPYKCTECKKTFRYKSQFDIHKRSHTTERPYKCTECLKTFTEKSYFSRHWKIHTNKGRYKCTECPKNFNDRSNFIRHRRIHTNERSYKCTDCPKTFGRKSNLSVHRRIHTNERPYKCSECPKTFNQNSGLNRHKRIHALERPYKCTECAKTFCDQSHYDRHKAIHTNEGPFKCTKCSQTFSDRSEFSLHKIIHIHERPFKCTDCPKTFSRKSNLSVHRRIHTNERPYKCTECPKTFRDNSYFNRHKKIHTNEISFKCYECPETFIQNVSFGRHPNTHA